MIKHVGLLVVRVKQNFQFLYFLIIYMPPSCKTEDYELLYDSLLSLHCIYNNDLIILGDFNIPEYLECKNNIINLTTIYNLTQNFCNFSELSQLNYIPRKFSTTVRFQILTFARLILYNYIVIWRVLIGPSLKIIVR